MALNQIFQSFPKIFKQIKKKDIRFLNKNWNNFIYLSIFFLLGLIFIIATNTINKINEISSENLVKDSDVIIGPLIPRNFEEFDVR